MYTPGKLIYFDPFEFENGNQKPKYFLVIKVVDGRVILASLPSSQSHLPVLQQISHGCLEIPDSCINCYIFQAHKPITKHGWAFPLDTFMHGCWLDEYDISHLEDKYQIEGVEYEIVGDLTDEELKDIIECFKNSASVKRKFRRLLSR
ncbi:MAG TPA: hypothetical protein VG890_01765 [Puia sp.]|nr:hypothetical protein [Puia sp.]